jgi:FxsC-like protein
VIPIVWFPPTHMPDAVQAIHDNAVTLGAAYAEWGLRQLIRLRRFHDDYEETVTAIADQIVELAEHSNLEPCRPDLPFGELVSPFVSGTTVALPGPSDSGNGNGNGVVVGGVPLLADGQVSAQTDPVLVEARVDSTLPHQAAFSGVSSAPGSRHVWFVIASAGSDEMRSVRSTLDCYGPTARHWMPYQPAMTRPLGSFAREIAGWQNFGSELAELDALDDRIAEANRENKIVVLLVDPWVARIAGYGAQLEAYDRRNEPTVPVLIALNDHDDETHRCCEALDEAVHLAFPNNMLRQDVIFRPAVGSAEQFAEDLQFVLQEAVNRLLRRGRVRRVPPIEATSVRPVLDGPLAT